MDNKQTAKSICIVGMTNTGKSYEVKRIPKHKKYIFDIQNEHQEFNAISGRLDSSENFLDKIEHVKNSVIVFEEATAFFGYSNSNRRAMKMLVNKRHDNNLIIFCFHALRFVPPYIVTMMDYFALKKTGDDEKKAGDKLGHIIGWKNKFLSVKNQIPQIINGKKMYIKTEYLQP